MGNFIGESWRQKLFASRENLKSPNRAKGRLAAMPSVARRKKIATHPALRWPWQFQQDPWSVVTVVSVVAVVFAPRVARAFHCFRNRRRRCGVFADSSFAAGFTFSDHTRRMSTNVRQSTDLSEERASLCGHARMRELRTRVRRKLLRTLPSVSCYWSPDNRQRGGKRAGRRESRATSRRCAKAPVCLAPIDGETLSREYAFHRRDAMRLRLRSIWCYERFAAFFFLF